MQQPEFWFRPPGIVSGLLLPFAFVVKMATRARVRRGKRARVGIPVICVGNLNVGGTGKTPFAIELVQHLSAAGEIPHAVSRGYGGRTRQATSVDMTRHGAKEVGDEPLLLASFAPTWVGTDRPECVRRAAQAGASVVVLDDGHQDASLSHDLSIVVVGSGRGFGNNLVMPAGPLREPVDDGLQRADLLVVAGSDPQRFRECWKIGSGLPVVAAEMTPLPTGKDWKGERVVAFAGIGDPGKFFACLAGLGAEIVRQVPLSDHQVLDERLLSRMEATADSQSAQLVTTEKDAVRLPRKWRDRVLTLPVRMKVGDWSDIDVRLEALGLGVPDGN